MIQGKEVKEGLERRGEGGPDGSVIRAEGESAGHEVGGQHVKECKGTGRRKGIVNGRRAGLEIGDQVAESGVEIRDR